MVSVLIYSLGTLGDLWVTSVTIGYNVDSTRPSIGYTYGLHSDSIGYTDLRT